ncbi:hypothetical protein PR202_ga02345 [Eleusine coracana subsp. coracana]|uniref:Uncharacterized protein n=1 Tax=Eleusine coracana subsp. coracana TaxID=191504 RepID=A0AAV5BJW9_ELECO|nr:hypothetical protein PR202_ga02345 [Eleusine coracana subsp. coracana]
MREAAMEADHERDDARRGGGREWRVGRVDVAEWRAAMAGCRRVRPDSARERRGLSRRQSYPVGLALARPSSEESLLSVIARCQ